MLSENDVMRVYHRDHLRYLADTGRPSICSFFGIFIKFKYEKAIILSSLKLPFFKKTDFFILILFIAL